ncbi:MULTISPECIES: aminotransferase class I/II-fold pyridoxal phosphate-dependent enzyme [unclassified Serratia (in: enterobacteria)]|uniref:aminotransferase class I/II-fold pyridoxal phosphate-dependent enzyme n=1 Tax=unclassified Serratia (in: enterobacteria) TaxID=2647522 RepID=UPI002ED64149|nr:aminotransferase class I/II-fold pyridoxal phosphate-dependent enzyme [Serratia sp. C2(2)]MEE4448997.1 aminotransferase class I/II-fold pyridoxal phosphate-dependent enzyme [Serratia sp. C2(1)]
MITRAIDSYQDIVTLDDTPTRLNLSWTQDERLFIRPDISTVIQQILQTEAKTGLPEIYRYAVTDPWGETTLRPAVKHYFSLAHDHFSLSCGAGVISLLAALTHLSKRQRVAIIGDVYPDFPWWLRQNGRESYRLLAGSEQEIYAGMCAVGADMLFLERPGLLVDDYGDLVKLRGLCQVLAQHGMLLLIDESNANYCSPAYSAVTLLGEMPNLIILRGVSKGWGLGGLRVGLCLCSSELQGKVRQTLPPLLNASLSLRIAANILALGDSTAELRVQIAHHKQQALALFEGQPILAASSALPYLFLAPEMGSALEARGVKGKNHLCWQGGEEMTTLLRLSIPLLPARLARLRQCMTSCSDDGGLNGKR